MNKVIDNGILLLFIAVIIFPIQAQFLPVTTLLLGIITAAIGIVYSANRFVRIALMVIFGTLCIFLPQLVYFLFYQKSKKLNFYV